VVGGAFQSIDCIRFRINREEVKLELLLKISPGLDRKNTSVCFLTKHVFRSLGGMTSFEECESLENPFFFIVELLQGQVDIERAGVQKCMAVVTFSTKVWRTKELGTCSSYHRSRGQRHWRRWYKQGGMFGMGGRGGLATAAIAEQSGLPVWCCSWRARYDRGGRSIGWLSTGIVQGSVLRILICCKGD